MKGGISRDILHRIRILYRRPKPHPVPAAAPKAAAHDTKQRPGRHKSHIGQESNKRQSKAVDPKILQKNVKKTQKPSDYKSKRRTKNHSFREQIALCPHGCPAPERKTQNLLDSAAKQKRQSSAANSFPHVPEKYAANPVRTDGYDLHSMRDI